MRRFHLLLVALPLGLSIAACGSTPTSPTPVSASPSSAAASLVAGSEGPSGAPSSAAPSSDASGTASTAPSSAPSATPSAGPSATPTSAPTPAPIALDPCALVTRSEAGKLARLAVGAGKEATVENRRYCTYSGKATLITVIVVQAPDAAALADAKATVVAELQAAANNKLATTSVSGIGDAAALLTLRQSSSSGAREIAIYVSKGLTFFAIAETTLGSTLASAQAMETQAKTTVRRVP